jgi:hypothetical protein
MKLPTRDQVYFAIAGHCINDLAAKNATDEIMRLLYPNSRRRKKELSEIPIGGQFRMIRSGVIFTKISQSSKKVYASTGKRDRWLFLNLKVFEIKKTD